MYESALVSYLVKRKDDRAMLAALRRGLGQPPGGAPDMFPYVVPFVRDEYDEVSYVIASLFALHPMLVNDGNMGSHLRIHKINGNEEAVTRRFVQLLRMREEDMATPLRQHIALLKSAGIGVNWHQLEYDLRYWGHVDRFVQKKWANAYWSERKS
jgi:CRISPR system Cascade subunit CasB